MISFSEVTPSEYNLDPAPVCDVGWDGHQWILSVEEGQVSLSSGCDICDCSFDVSDACELLFLKGGILGQLKVVPEHPNLGGWHGTTRCDCGWWYEFIPEVIARDTH